MAVMRNIPDRLKWYASHRPSAVGMCAEHVMLALDVPKQGLPDASAVFRATPSRHIQHGRAPEGAILYFTGGKDGHGHTCFALGNGTELSVDVRGVNPDGSPRMPGIVPFDWFARNWPSLRYEGWSWWWGKIDTEERIVIPRLGLPLDRWPVGKGLMHKTPLSAPVTVRGGQWTTMTIIDLPQGGDFVCTLQVRMPRGVAAGEARLGRMGWGTAHHLGEIDDTAHNPIPPATVIQRWRTPIQGHPIDTGSEGGPLAYQIYLPPGWHKMRVVAKALRVA